MLKPLRRKLALAYALMAGVVLALVSFACLRTAENQLNLAAQSAFESGVNSVIYKLQSDRTLWPEDAGTADESHPIDRTLSHAWLAQSEAGARQIIFIEEGGVPLSFRGAWTPETDRAALIERALAQSDALGLGLPLGSLEPAGVSFELQGDTGDRYLASVTLIPTIGQTMRAAVIKDMASEDARVRQQRKTVLLLASAGLVLLMGSGWLYSGRAVKPAEENHRRQVEFIALASHELKAPLAVITASADALKGGEQDALLHNITGESARMARLVDDLLLLSRADAKTWSLRKTPVDADTLLIECYELFRPLAAAKGLDLAIDLPDARLPALYGDMERLKQALSVVLDNALSYTPAGGHVVLRARATGRRLLVEVTDDGPGVPHEQKLRVFDRFYRAEASHTDRNHVGLGLSIARELVQLHGGRIMLEDAHPHGARFILELPITPRAKPRGRA